MLALSQSAVSAALTDLEGQLGVQLFDRVGKRLVVNEHGGCFIRGRWRCWSGRWRSNSCFAATTARSASTPAAPSATIFCRKSLPAIAAIFRICRWS
jgi:hypothetical protein